MIMMDVPGNLEVPEGATQHYADRVRHVNMFLTEARSEMAAMKAEAKRVTNIRANFPIHNGPGGTIFYV